MLPLRGAMTMSRGNIIFDRTILPSETAEDEGLEKLRDVFAQDAGLPKLVGPDGEHLPLSDAFYDLVMQMLQALTEGIPVTVNAGPNRAALVSTTQAADILGISRPTMVRFLEGGRLPYTQPGKHRRLRLEDVLEFKKRVSREQHEVVAEIQDLATKLSDEAQSGAES